MDDLKPIFSELSDIPRLKQIVATREFTWPAQQALVNQVEKQLIQIQELQAQLEQEREKKAEILKYCEPHTEQMWAAYIVGILLECDFRDAKAELDKYAKGEGDE